MEKLSNSKANVLAKLIRSQAEQAIGAAVNGKTIERMSFGISFQRNLRLLALECQRMRVAAK